MISELITRITRRGVTTDDIDALAKKLGLIRDVVDATPESMTIKYRTQSQHTIRGNDTIMTYMSGDRNPVIRLARPLALVPGTGSIMIKYCDSLVPAYTSKEMLEQRLTQYVKEIEQYEHASAVNAISDSKAALEGMLSEEAT